jgi:glycosyltransferase involved in cell wall biosynthesis
MSDLPKISVVVGTRNRVTYLKRLLDGLLREDYPNMEIVVVDGASTDGTVELLKSYGQGAVRWISEPDGGEYFAYNKAIAMASGEIIKPMCDDDLLRPGALKYGAEYFQENPEVDIVFGRTEFWDVRTGTGEPSKCWPTRQVEPAQLSLRNWLRQIEPALMVAAFLRKRVFEQIGRFETKYVCGDVEFLARAAFRGIKMGVMPQIVTDYYFTGNNGQVTKWRQIEWDLLAINRRYGTASDVLHCLRTRIIPLHVSWVYHNASWVCHKLGIHPLRFLDRIKSKLAATTRA